MISFGKGSSGESNFAKACEVYGSALAKFIVSNQTLPKLGKFIGQLWQSSSRRIKLCQSLRSLWVSFGKGSSRRIKLCQSLRSLWVSFGKVYPDSI